MSLREHFVWVEKYRPQTLDECILPVSTRQTLDGILKQQSTPNLLLSGRAGTGKTTVARALVRELDADALIINASDENGIDVLRNKIKDYASSFSLDAQRKYVILDEADYLNPQSTQPALRAFMEEFAQTCGFILTCNLPQRIIPPLHSRCSLVDFKIPATERAGIAGKMMTRCADILKTEGVAFNLKTVAEVVKLYFPDFRRTLNELQRFSGTGTLSDAILSQMTDKDVAELFVALKSKDYGAVRKWVALHDDMDAAAFYRMLTDQMPKQVVTESLPEIIVQMADYSYRSAFAADQQLNALACLTEIMHSGQFK
jgi:DNA polymerase III delta prime subunit